MIPTRDGSNPFSPASASASRPAATPSRTFRSSFRASFGDTTCVGSNPFTSAATRTGRPSVSNVEIQSIPLSPASAARQVEGDVEPERRDRADAGDGDALHRAKPTSSNPCRRPSVPFPPMEAELVRELPEGEGWQYEPKWDGFRGVLENVGRRARPLVAQRAAAAALLPGAAPARRAAAAALGARRRDRDRARRRARLRRDADAAPSGGVADPEALRGDPRRVRRLRRAGLGRRAGLEAAARGAARARRGASTGFRISPATRDLADARGWLDRFEALGLDGVVGKRLDVAVPARARATASSRSRSTRPPTASSSAFAGRATGARSRRCCSACTATTAGSTTSARAPSAARMRDEVARRVLPLLDEIAGPAVLGAEPLGHGRARGGAGAARARRRGALRQGAGQPLPPRHEAHPLARRQGSRRLHVARAAPAARRHRRRGVEALFSR